MLKSLPYDQPSSSTSLLDLSTCQAPSHSHPAQVHETFHFAFSWVLYTKPLQLIRCKDRSIEHSMAVVS